jgi:hypothetical protein
VADNSLTGPDISEASLTGDVRRLRYGPIGDSRTPTAIATVGPYTIKGACFVGAATSIHLYARGPAGTADVMFDRTSNDSTDLGAESRGLLIPANADTEFASSGIVSGTNYQRIGGTAMLQAGAVLVQVNFNAVADNRGAGSCFIYGTATRAT